ncbi:MAG: HemK/PrmC family methyltransferase [Bacteroidales bacterium]
MTYKTFIADAITRLSDVYPLGEAKVIANRVLMYYLKISEYEYLVDPNIIIPKSKVKEMELAMDQLVDSRPIQYVLGYEFFAGHKFKVNETVLIPRPETEELFRIIREDYKKDKYSELKILDACTGSGCLAYSLASAFPKSMVVGLDKFDDVLEIAKNQKIYQKNDKSSDNKHPKLIDNPPIFVKYDLLAGPPEIEDLKYHNNFPEIRDLDILVSNPPYVMESEKEVMNNNVVLYEPDAALFVPDKDPLKFYKALADWAAKFLKVGGRAYFEINEALGTPVKALYEKKGFSDVEILQDMHKKNRFVRFTKWF